MADLTEAIIDYIQTSADVGALHIGEVIPQGVAYPYIWLMRSGEVINDELCQPASVQAVTVDVEVVSDDIAEAREITSELKKHLRLYEIHEVEFVNDDGDDQTIHAIDVDDHDDNYIPKSVASDEELHVSAVQLTVQLGEIV